MIADDHNIVRTALKSFLEYDEEICVTASVGTAAEIVKICLSKKPDILLLDIEMPDMTGFEVITELQKKKSETKIILLTMHDSIQYLKDGLKKGIKGFVLKNSQPEELCTAIHKVHSGGVYIVSEMAYKMATDSSSDQSQEGKNSLSNREEQIIRAIGNGLSLKKISDDLYLSISSVSSYKSRAKIKLGLKTDADIIKWCINKGILD